MTEDEFEEKLVPLLTDEFLSVLVTAVKTCGWMVDHIEASAFVYWCYQIAEKECPDLTPYMSE